MIISAQRGSNWSNWNSEEKSRIYAISGRLVYFDAPIMLLNTHLYLFIRELIDGDKVGWFITAMKRKLENEKKISPGLVGK